MNENLTRGLWRENPTFVMLIGMCPTLAVTTGAINGLAMGLATTAVLIFSNLIISLLRRVIPKAVRIPSFIVIIASLVTVVDMVMAAYLPDIHRVLGLFIPLIIVNCIIMGRAEAFAFKNPPVESVFDGLGMGIGFTWALTLLGSVRELLGSGSIFGVAVMGQHFQPVILALLPPGAFITLGLIIATFKAVELNQQKKLAGGLYGAERSVSDTDKLSLSK